MSRIDIITRTVNRPRLLERALNSVLAQTFSDWHWVIVDSGVDHTVAALLQARASDLQGRVTHLRFTNPHPGMRGIPINAGIQASRSEFITLLDDDDTWDPGFLQIMIHALDQKPISSVRGAVCRTLCIDESSVQDGLQPLRSYELNPELCNVTLASLAVVNRFCTHAFVYERAALDRVGLYPDSYPVLEDWYFNLRFALHYEILVVARTLTNYHFRPPDVQGEEANSQNAERGDHKFHEARLINEALREDIRSGKPGLGHLLTQGALTRQLMDTLHDHGSRLKTISDKTGKIDSRTKELKDRFTRNA
jgi:glycosyltransferase involved in cell wall biosynthesis